MSLNFFTVLGTVLLLANPSFASGPVVSGQLLVDATTVAPAPVPVTPPVAVLVAPNDTPATPVDDSKCDYSITKLDAGLAADTSSQNVVTNLGRYKTVKNVEFFVYKVVAPNSNVVHYMAVLVDKNNCVAPTAPAEVTIEIINGLVAGTL